MRGMIDGRSTPPIHKILFKFSKKRKKMFWPKNESNNSKQKYYIEEGVIGTIPWPTVFMKKCDFNIHVI